MSSNCQKLSCTYLHTKGGLHFEIIDVYGKEEEPPEAWVPTPLNACEEEVLNKHM